MKTRLFALSVFQLCLLYATALQAQTHQVNLSSPNAAPNNCGARTITANVTGGSGNFNYFWSAVPTTGINLGNSPTISVSPTVTTEVTSAVQDVISGQFATASITIGRILTGSFSVSIPGSFTPNGDGINDNWEVMDGSNGTGPINAYKYELTIRNAANQVIFNKTETLTTGIEGIIGGYISWNGRINGNGNIVPNGFYTYVLKLFNCSGDQLYQGNIVVLGSSSSGSQVFFYPNPAKDFVEVLFTEADKFSEFDIIIRNEKGLTVVNQKSSEPLTHLPLPNLEKGWYYLSLQTIDGLQTTRLMIDP